MSVLLQKKEKKDFIRLMVAEHYISPAFYESACLNAVKYAIMKNNKQLNN